MKPGVGSPFPAPAAAVTSSDPANFWRWDLPLPYLFGALAAMMSLIALALIILACSNRKSVSAEGGCSPDGRKPMRAPVDTEPSVVVIMAGDALPSFLAKAVPAVPHSPARCEN